MEIDLERDGRLRRGQVHREGDDTLRVEFDGGEARTVRVIARDENTLLLDVDGRRHRLRWVRRGRELHLGLRGQSANFHWVEEDEVDETAAAVSPVVRAPMPGRVLEVTVAEGDTVTAGQVVARIEAMKMEIALSSEVAGRVVTLHAGKDALVEPDQAVVTVEPDGDAD